MSSPEPLAFLDNGLGNSSCRVDLGDRRGSVVDPARHPGAYLAEADRRGMTIAYSVETPLDADSISHGRELGALGATVLAPAAAAHQFAVRRLNNGDQVDPGGLRLGAMAMPGHTPEHLAYLLFDGSYPAALFSGVAPYSPPRSTCLTAASR